MRKQLVILGAAMVALAGCASDDPHLFNVNNSARNGGEFTILPSKSIEIPQDKTQLPPPTPGGVNRTDPTPKADAITALGGNPASLNRQGSDGNLVHYAGRHGVDGNIRGDLATEDHAYRQKNQGRLLERTVGNTVYYNAYEPMELDQHKEAERFQRAGVKTSAPPPIIPKKQTGSSFDHSRND